MTWVDCTDSNYLNISGSTFTAINRMGNTAYDFIQSDPFLHPAITTNGVTFRGSQRLVPRQLDIFTALLQPATYSMIFITKSNPIINQQLLSIGKINTNLPSFLDVQQDEGASLYSFSNGNVENFITFQPFTGNTQVLMFSHDVRLGKTAVSVNKAPFVEYINTNRGYILNNFPSNFYLGNAPITLPFVGELLHFLVFKPGITNAQMMAIANLLSDTKPVLTASNLDIPKTNQVIVDLSSLINLDTSVIYTVPYVVRTSSKNSVLDLTTEISLSFYFNWDTLDVANWDAFETEYWDNIQ